MRNIIHNFYTYQSVIYKFFLFILTTVLIVYTFPKGGKFKYDFSDGQPWQYENLYAPFDFAIQKPPEELADERNQIEANFKPYFTYDDELVQRVKNKFNASIKTAFTDLSKDKAKKVRKFAMQTLDELYTHGVLAETYDYKYHQPVYLKKGNNVNEVHYGLLTPENEIGRYVAKKVKDSPYKDLEKQLLALFFTSVEANVSLDAEFTQRALREELNQMLTTRGSVTANSRIIAKGEVVEGNKLLVLQSLKSAYESQVWSKSKYYYVVFGYCITIALALVMLLLFIRKYRPAVYENNTRVTFLFFNILFIVILTTMVVKYQVAYVYVVPVCILPLMIKAFFDARLGLFTHIITILLLGFVVPNKHEYIFLQTITGIVTILTSSELYKRANLFISVGQITLIYVIGYIAFHIIYEGSFDQVKFSVLLLFILCGFATLMVHPLIYAFEKIFGLVSDVSLLELSDTNSKLLRQLSDVAPGTLHHSLNVANIAEAAANEVGANAMLVRVGALYHDIGKMINPTYFTENQTGTINPHDNLSPQASASIIIGHVSNGIELAKRNKLPDRLIDFIRTHHGTSLVYYFYSKAKEVNPEISEASFRYPGPKPFSKETAILMMADSVEAASKSLKKPTSIDIDKLVEKIIDKQMENGQFLNADITFKEIGKIKKVMKGKLTNIYHLRVEYPE